MYLDIFKSNGKKPIKSFSKLHNVEEFERAKYLCKAP